MKLEEDTTRQKAVVLLTEFLERCEEIVFAFLHGSFVTGDKYRDVDCAVFIDKKPMDPAEYELDLETSLILSRLLPAEADIRLLNSSLVSFSFNDFSSFIELS